jgi:hypothetical protein
VKPDEIALVGPIVKMRRRFIWIGQSTRRLSGATTGFRQLSIMCTVMQIGFFRSIILFLPMSSEGGGHFMIMNKSTEVNEALKEILASG